MTDFKQVGIEFETRGAETARRDIERVAKAGDKAAAGLGKSERAARGAAKGFKGAGDQAKRIPTTMRPAAGSVGNLTAQFNDIGVMLASGQSPLLLATQQGTQVSQVLAQMRGQGQSTFGALRAGLKSMLGPMQLFTIAGIAGGAALVQWVMEAIRGEDAARNLADGLESANEALDEYAATSAALIQSNEKLEESFGSVADQVRDTYREIRELDRQAARRALGASAGALLNEDALRVRPRTGGQLFAAATPGLRDTLPGSGLRSELEAAVAVLQRGAGTAQELHATARDVTALGRELIDLDGKQTEQEKEILRALLEQEQAYGRLVGEAERSLEVETKRAKAVKEIALVSGPRPYRPGQVADRVRAELAENSRIRREGFELIAGPKDRAAGSVAAEVRAELAAELEAELTAPGVWESLGAALQTTLSTNLARAFVSGNWDSLGLLFVNSVAEALARPAIDKGVSAVLGIFGLGKTAAQAAQAAGSGGGQAAATQAAQAAITGGGGAGVLADACCAELQALLIVEGIKGRHATQEAALEITGAIHNLGTELRQVIAHGDRAVIAELRADGAGGINLGDILDTGREILNFDGGGTVPGYPGQPRFARVHGQETIRTPAQERGLHTLGGYGPPRIAVTIHATGDVTQATRAALRRSGKEIATLAATGLRERRLI